MFGKKKKETRSRVNDVENTTSGCHSCGGAGEKCCGGRKNTTKSSK